MASIAVYIDVRDGIMTAQSRFAVGEARRIASAKGATVYGLIAFGTREPAGLAQIIDGLGEAVLRAGADRVFCCSDPSLAGPVLDGTHGPLVLQLAEHLRPLLFLFPAGGVGWQLAPPLAIRIGAVYVPRATLGLDKRGVGPGRHGQDSETATRVVVRRWRGGGQGQRRVDVADLERPIVAVLSAGPMPAPSCVAEADVELVPCPPRKVSLTATALGADRCAAVELAPALVVTGDLAEGERAELERQLPPGAALAVVPPDDEAVATASPGTLVVVGRVRATLPPPTARDGWLELASVTDLVRALDRRRAAPGAA